MRIPSSLLLFLFVAAVTAQDIPDPAAKDKTLWNNFTYDMGNVFGGIGYAYSRPLHWQGNQWANFGYIAAGTGALFTIDDEVDQWANGFREDVPQLIKDYGNNIGNPDNNYLLTGAVYLTGLFTKNEKLRRTGVLLISSATASGFFQQVAKRVVGRARPRADIGSFTFAPTLGINRKFNFDSFPSGHAMLAFTNAYAIAKQFKNPWVKSGIYTIGMIPGIVRVLDRFHWISDVAFSTVFSIFVVESIDRFLDRKYDKKYNDQEKDLSWNLTFAPNRIGVAIQF